MLYRRTEIEKQHFRKEELRKELFSSPTKVVDGLSI